MKKLMIACAAVLALGLSSCGNTKMCYLITFSVDGEKVYEYYAYGTSNDIDASIASQKKAQELILGTTAIEVSRSSIASLASEEDCNAKNRNN